MEGKREGGWQSEKNGMTGATPAVLGLNGVPEGGGVLADLKRRYKPSRRGRRENGNVLESNGGYLKITKEAIRSGRNEDGERGSKGALQRLPSRPTDWVASIGGSDSGRPPNWQANERMDHGKQQP